MNWLALTQQEWLDIGISVLIFLVIAFLGRRLIKFIFKRVIRRLISQTKTTFDDVLLDAIAPPFFWLALVYAFKFSLNRLDFIFDQRDQGFA